MKKVQVATTQKTRNQISWLHFKATNSQNTNIFCKQNGMKMKQVPESGTQIRNINQSFLMNEAKKGGGDQI